MVAPHALSREPGMWWLESEHHRRLDSEATRLLEDTVGVVHVGAWPYCVPTQRWNRAASQQRWLPVVRSASALGSSNAVATPFGWAPALANGGGEQAARPQRATPLRERVADGAGAVASLFEHLARAGRLMLTAGALGACAYYLAAVVVWLWALRDGMSSAELQGGAALAVGALVATWLTGRFEERLVFGNKVLHRLPRSTARRRQPFLHVTLDAYRTGVVLQLLAFAGFVLT